MLETVYFVSCGLPVSMVVDRVHLHYATFNFRTHKIAIFAIFNFRNIQNCDFWLNLDILRAYGLKCRRMKLDTITHHM